MKYEVITKVTSENAYTVEANSPQEAERIVQDMIDNGDTDLAWQIYDTGEETVLEGQTSELK